MADVAALLREALLHEQAGRNAEAVAAYESILAQYDEHPTALLKLGVHARASGRLDDAYKLLGRALKSASARGSNALPMRLALAELATDARSQDASAWLELGGILMEVELLSAAAREVRPAPLERALSAFESALALAPEAPAVLSQAAMAFRYACAWDHADACVRKLESVASDDTKQLIVSPMMAATLIDEASLQARMIADFSVVALPKAQRAPGIAQQRGDKLRIGYLSSDFHDHATAHLAAGVLDHHDHSRVTMFAYAHDRDDGSAMRKRLVAAFDHWRDVHSLDDAKAAALIKSDALDVLVDLKGHTQGNRLGILASRPAPTQIHWLGFPGTLAYDGIDALVADSIVVPSGAEVHYREPILRLPNCYQANDSARPLPPPASRSAVGLTDDAIVLVSFNQTCKLDRRFVDAWLDVLSHHPATLLWLTVPHALARENLQAAARQRGIAIERIVFAPFAKQIDHLARLRCADLALDVLPYGSHTTGSDALWCGVPLLTLAGETFAGRVGASLVSAAGLAEMCAESFDDYCARLNDLVSDRAQLPAHKAHLERERMRLPVFDTSQFTRDFEKMLERAANRNF